MTKKRRVHINIIIIFFALAVSCLPMGTPKAFAGDYLKSIHGRSVQRPDLAGVYAIGNCAHCHEQHSSITTSTAGEPSPNDPAGPDVYLAGGNEEVLCFECHDGSPTTDIKTDVTTPDNHGHLAQNYTGIHRTEETLDDIAASSAKKHIECTDCHNPHAVGNNLHTPGSETAATVLASDSPLNNVTGADPDYFSTSNKYGIWQAPPQSDYIQQSPATKEYQICFKCHSASVGTPATWSGTSDSSTAWTDVGLEFSPYNRSGHPIVTGLDSYPNSKIVTGTRRGLNNITDNSADWDQLLDDPWGPNHGIQTMYCSDCHKGSSASGPHGSVVKWMLSGPNQAWPYLTSAKNGSADTEVVADYPDYQEKFRRLRNIRQDLGTTDGVFCANCHPVSSYVYTDQYKTNNVHALHNHRNGRCIDCHIRVPHGGKVSRLIAAVNEETYSGNYMPNRYTADGNGLNGDGENKPIVRKFTKLNAGSYTNSNYCYSTSTSVLIQNDINPKPCSTHSSTMQQETWGP